MTWEEDQETLKNMVRNHFIDLFHETERDREQLVGWNTYPTTQETHHAELRARVTLEEVKRAIFDMGPHKAPGEDGFPAYFFQQYQDLTATSLLQFIHHIWETPESIVEVNNTLLVLIPKVDNSEFVTQFKPIALCNVAYKLITKVIVNWIKPHLNGMISPYQSSFIPGRTIHHNIIIAQEMVHAMNKMTEKKEFMSIKIDLEKAYDRVNWNFVITCLEECWFPPELINIIKHCLCSSSFKILWNEDKTNEFNPSRGIRQGDSLSPYLFVICLEKVSHIIANQVEADYWKPMRAGKNGPQVSHLFLQMIFYYSLKLLSNKHTVLCTFGHVLLGLWPKDK